MGLIVDVPKPGMFITHFFDCVVDDLPYRNNYFQISLNIGFGNSNDGNTARRFFQNPSETSRITGLDEEIIKRCRNVLVAINSSHEVDPAKFKTYALKTAELYIQKYSFYAISPTVHKVLLHGGDIMEHSILPTGQYQHHMSPDNTVRHFKFIFYVFRCVKRRKPGGVSQIF